jgi:hypothetical protein
MRRSQRSSAALSLGPLAFDAELVPLGISENDPAGAVRPEMVSHEGRAELDNAVDFLVASLSLEEVDVHTILPRLPFWHPLEQQTRLTSSQRAHGLRIAWMIVSAGWDAEHLAPPQREAVGIGTVNSDASDRYGHRRLSLMTGPSASR